MRTCHNCPFLRSDCSLTWQGTGWVCRGRVPGAGVAIPTKATFYTKDVVRPGWCPWDFGETIEMWDRIEAYGKFEALKSYPGPENSGNRKWFLMGFMDAWRSRGRRLHIKAFTSGRKAYEGAHEYLIKSPEQRDD